MTLFKYIISFFKKNFLTIIFILFTISLVFFSKTNISSVKSGLNLFINSIIPSLFPFFIAIELLSYTNIVQILGKLLNKFMRPVFNLPGEAGYALLIGLLSGYPVRRQSCNKLKKQ